MAKIASFSQNGQHFYGVVRENGLVAVSPDFPNWPTLKEVIENNGLDVVLEAATGRDVTHQEEDITWEIPIPAPEKIICVGVNFPDRNAEYKDGKEAPPNMSLFPRFPRSFVGHRTPLTRPPESPQLDYEGEIAIVIGKGGRRIPEESALDHIAGLTLCNEGTIRDWVRHAKFNVTQGKNWEGSGAMGPWLVPFTSYDQILDVGLRTRVNGEQRQ
ncbi:MAG: fumarylacetoacetate hydrolase family protein, partial [Pseudomonadota bacterium]